MPSCHGCLHSEKPLAWRAKVVALWLSGASASTIAAAVGSTKNAVVAFRRRSQLPARGSPLRAALPLTDKAPNRKAQQQRQYRARRSEKKRREAAEAIAKLVTASDTPREVRSGGAAALGEAATSLRRPKGEPPVLLRYGFCCCQFITDDTPRRQRFCDAPVEGDGATYCAAHAQRCYQQHRRRAA